MAKSSDQTRNDATFSRTSNAAVEKPRSNSR
jgi:hypothetical protein